MKNLTQRAITGTAVVVILLGAALWNQWSFLGLFLIITVISLWEFYQLSENNTISPQKIYGVLLGLGIFIAFNLIFSNRCFPACLVSLIPFIFMIFFIELYRKKDHPFTNVAYTLLGLCFIALPFSLLNYLCFYSENGYDPKLLVGYFILIWTNDTAAYFIGSKYGEHKLFKRISPNKSWEGVWSGLVFNLISAYIISHYFHDLSITQWLIMSLIVTLSGTYGDLVESSFKRSINYKDSGKILPGHGGILDRFDSMLFSIPYVVVYLYVLKEFNL